MASRYPGLGTLREKITLQQQSRVLDTGGGAAVTWSAVTGASDIAARIEPIGGREIVQAMAVQAPASHRITIRWRSGVTTAMRVLYGTRTFNIRAAVNIDERDRFIELLCEEGVAT